MKIEPLNYSPYFLRLRQPIRRKWWLRTSHYTLPLQLGMNSNSHEVLSLVQDIAKWLTSTLIAYIHLARPQTREEEVKWGWQVQRRIYWWSSFDFWDIRSYGTYFRSWDGMRRSRIEFHDLILILDIFFKDIEVLSGVKEKRRSWW